MDMERAEIVGVAIILWTLSVASAPALCVAASTAMLCLWWLVPATRSFMIAAATGNFRLLWLKLYVLAFTVKLLLMSWLKKLPFAKAPPTSEPRTSPSALVSGAGWNRASRNTILEISSDSITSTPTAGDSSQSSDDGSPTTASARKTLASSCGNTIESK